MRCTESDDLTGLTVPSGMTHVYGDNISVLER